MYADDIVILADDPEILENMINNLENYCNMWGMEVNLSKSQIMIFRKGGKMSVNESWKFNGEQFEIVKDYKYLGLTLTPKMSYIKHINLKNDAAKTTTNST